MKTTCDKCGIVKIPHKCHTDTRVKDFECKPYCVFPKLSGVVFNCDNCIKEIMKPLTAEQKEKILVILNES